MATGGKYVPPAMRGKAGDQVKEEKRDDTQDIRYASQDIRFAKDDGGGRGAGGPGPGGGGKQAWSRRQDGRRADDYGAPSEHEIFGDRKTDTGVIDFSKYDDIPIDLSGKNKDHYKPLKLFEEADLSDQLSWNLERCGYKQPTPVQQYSIPIVTSGRDVMACAQTGSGKTCAFMVPCLESLLRSGPPPDRSARGRPVPSCCALVLAPTRELAIQIHEESLKFGYNTGIRCKIVYGGADIREQVRELQKGTDILVATPGRLTDLNGRNYIDLCFTQFLILDEADRMLDMGFEPQVREIVERAGMSRSLDKHQRRQTMMFSATFGNAVQRMAGDFLEDYIFITVGRVGACAETITQTLLYAEEGKGKTRMLERTLRDNKPPEGFLTVIFVETKRNADTLERDLWDSGMMCCCIHGDRTQSEREDALAAFKSGETPILVATDVAARGLDISNVGLVVNYDMPKQMDDYVHRIGRTGRAGRKGTAIAFVNERCRYLTELTGLLRQAKQEVPSWIAELARSSGGYSGKGKGKGGPGGGYGAPSMAKDIREQSSATSGSRDDWKGKSASAKAEPKKEEPPAPTPRTRTPSPPREVPDAWDDSDDDA